MLNHKLWLVLQVDLSTCWNTRRTSGGCVGLLFAQTTPNRMICMNEVMKLTVDDTSLHLSSNRTTIFVIWILMWCVKWMTLLVGKVGTRSVVMVEPHFVSSSFFLLLSPPGWMYASRISYYIWWKITFREVCNIVYNSVWPLHLNRFDRFLIFVAYMWGFWTTPFSTI